MLLVSSEPRRWRVTEVHGCNDRVLRRDRDPLLPDPLGHPNNTASFYDRATVGDRLSLVFRPNEGSTPPYSLKITSPSGAVIVDSIVRDLPTGLPQSPPAVEFVVSVKGLYRVDIRTMRGRQRGEGTIRIS